LQREIEGVDRASDPVDYEISFGPFRLLPARRLLLEGAAPISLGSRALDLLIALAERPGKVVRPAIRLSALMELPTIFVFTHDAMGDGEDGPTHQPVEQLISLRAVPGLVVLRPGDANEVVEAYRYVLQLRHQPAVIALSRQPLPTFDRRKYASAAGVARGAYVMADATGGPPEIILIASGSEVSLVVEAHEALASQGIRSRVVSTPSWDIFEHQPQSYRESVLPAQIKARIAVEQGSALGWDRYIGAAGRVIGMETFGASAPLKELQRKFGFEPERIVDLAREMLGGKQ
jgi:transketolase